jgi:signal transduction histidine kinase
VSVSKVWAAWPRWRDSPVRDAVLAVVVTAVIVAGAYGEAHPTQVSDQVIGGHPVPHTPAAAFLLVVAAGLVLAWRRRYPVPVLAASGVLVCVFSLLGYVNGSALLLPTVALYTAAAAVSARRAVVVAAITLVVLLGCTAIGNPFGPTGGGIILLPALVIAALFAGLAASNRRAYIASISARAQDEARRRVDEERLRIARELHDVVAHTMATINVQAGVAGHVLKDRPEAAAEALRIIRTASKDGLRELRAILNVLRQADEADPTQPAPGLAQVDALIAGASQAGLATSLRRTGAPRPLPSEVDVAAYRIIQESLTNAIRHAGPAAATVCLSYDEAGLRVEVADTGRGAAAVAGAPPGHGLIGMRERAAAAGGTLETGPGPDGGFRVAARFPAVAPAASELTPADPVNDPANGTGTAHVEHGAPR